MTEIGHIITSGYSKSLLLRENTCAVYIAISVIGHFYIPDSYFFIKTNV